jgi:hypothetical protein
MRQKITNLTTSKHAGGSLVPVVLGNINGLEVVLGGISSVEGEIMG